MDSFPVRRWTLARRLCADSNTCASIVISTPPPAHTYVSCHTIYAFNAWANCARATRLPQRLLFARNHQAYGLPTHDPFYARVVPRAHAWFTAPRCRIYLLLNFAWRLVSAREHCRAAWLRRAPGALTLASPPTIRFRLSTVAISRRIYLYAFAITALQRAVSIIYLQRVT